MPRPPRRRPAVVAVRVDSPRDVRIWKQLFRERIRHMWLRHSLLNRAFPGRVRTRPNELGGQEPLTRLDMLFDVCYTFMFDLPIEAQESLPTEGRADLLIPLHRWAARYLKGVLDRFWTTREIRELVQAHPRYRHELEHVRELTRQVLNLAEENYREDWDYQVGVHAG